MLCKTGVLSRSASQEKRYAEAYLFSWLGMRDSNPRMSAPKADALPLGESPTDQLGTDILYPNGGNGSSFTVTI